MKQGIHPPYGLVAFRDPATARLFLTRSNLAGGPLDTTVEIDGVAYPGRNA